MATAPFLFLRGGDMRLVLRRRRAGETDCELVFGTLFVPLVLVAAWLVTRLPSEWLPVCAFRVATGVPCPTCGAYRCTCLLASGEPVAALRMNPLATTAVVAGLLWFLYSLVVVVAGLPRVRVEGAGRPGQWGVFWMLVLLLLLNWAYLIVSGL